MIKKNIGVRFINHSEWTGGIYYISNLINALNILSLDKRPNIIVYCNIDEVKIARNLFIYPKIKFFVLDKKLNFFQRVLNKICRMFSLKEMFPLYPEPKSVDFVFPNPENYYFKGFKRIFWIPDFQENYLPDLFSKEEKRLRKFSHSSIADNNETVVLSSLFCEKDFRKIFPYSKSKTFVLPFAVTHPEYSYLNIEQLKVKYNLPDQWLITTNQFWIHKNHELIIEAISIVVKKNPKVKILFTGKEYDYRDPEFTNRLKKKVKILNLNDNITFLGFIDRKDQLQLMNNALCVIQPSLSEGWSTVIEDAKAMNQIILASNIEVHQEQLLNWEGSKLFFDKNNPTELAEAIENVLNNKLKRKLVNYDSSRLKFATEFLKIAETVV